MNVPRYALPLLALLLPACKEVPLLPSVTPHRMEIQQGNFVTQEMVEKLQPGMTRSQVRFLLGTPLVVDPFRTDRWDYFYARRVKGEWVEQRRIVIIFVDDKLARIEGDVVPGAASRTGGTVAPEKPKPDAKPAATAAAVEKPAVEKAGAEKPAAAKPTTEKPKPEPAKEERGFFGRMLERIGF